MASGKWIRVQSLQPNAADTPAPRFAHQMVYDPATKTHYLFGGNPSTFAEVDALPKSRLGDLWTLQLQRPRAEEVLQRAKFLVRKQRCAFSRVTAED
jgi:hypothetical protein